MADHLQARLARIQARAEHMEAAWLEERLRLFPEQPLPHDPWAQETNAGGEPTEDTSD